MNHDDIDRALREDETIEPSAGFTSRVMRDVRDAAEDPGPIRFPWSRALPGFLACTLSLVLGIVAARQGAGGAAIATAIEKALRGFPVEIVTATTAPLLATWLLVRLCLRLAGYRR